MMAQSVRRGRGLPISVDLFADLDTRAASHAWYRLPSKNGRIDPEPLERVVETVLADHRPEGWIYGSGCDALTDQIEKIARRCPLYGNRPEVARICTRPRQFFLLLDRLAIPYPEIHWLPPTLESNDSDRYPNWLVKRGGEGGRGVSVWQGERWGEGYCQRRLRGPVYTLVFLAGKGRVWWYGFNRLYQADYNADNPFLFAGAINRADLSAEVEATILAYARRLSVALDLRGIGGLDFMLEGESPRILEFNPRPGAALGLWDMAWPTGLMAAQIQVCRDRPLTGFRPVPVGGFRIVFAQRRFRMAPCRWPSWCADLPPAGTEMTPGTPVCSVTASGGSVTAVEARLKARELWVKQRLLDHLDECGEVKQE